MSKIIEIYSDQFNMIGPGGQYRVLMAAKGLVYAGYKVFLITPYFKTTYTEILRYPKKYYVNRETLYHTVYGKLNYYVSNSFILPALAQTHFPSIIVMPSPIFKVNVATIKKKIHEAPVLVDFGDIYFSSSDPSLYKHFSTNYLNIFLTKYVDYLVLPTERMLEIFRRAFPHLFYKMIHIPSSIDTELFTPSRKTPYPTIAFIGSLSYGRGAEILPAIIRKVVRSFSEVRFLIAGSGTLKSQIEKTVNAMQLKKYVDFIGNVDFLDIPKIFGSCWIGLSLYPTETLYPVDVLKALAYMSLGVPLVSSTYIEEAKEVSIKVPFSAEKFAEAILSLIKNEELRSILSKKARQLAIDNYDVHVIAKKYHTLLSSFEED